MRALPAFLTNANVTATAAFFTLGTLGYAVATVLNDALAVYDLSVLWA